MTTPIIMCLDAGSTILQPSSGGGNPVCGTYSTNWAPLSTVGAGAYTYTSTCFASDVANMTWCFTVAGGTLGPITCTQNGCQG